MQLKYPDTAKDGRHTSRLSFTLQGNAATSVTTIREVAPDWCHLSIRVPYSCFHRLAKQADIGWEDKKYAYMAFSRQRPNHFSGRVLAQPRKTAGQIILKLCEQNGEMVFRHVAGHQADGWRKAKKPAGAALWKSNDGISMFSTPGMMFFKPLFLRNFSGKIYFIFYKRHLHCEKKS